MCLREKKAFAKRKRESETQEAKRKYFLVFEGEKTEMKYFEAVELKRDLLGINPLIELCPIVRGHSESGWSNPQKILDKLLDVLKGKYTYGDIIDRIIDALYEYSEIANMESKDAIFSSLKNYTSSQWGKNVSDLVEGPDVAKSMLEFLNKENSVDGIFKNLHSKISTQEILFSKDIDVMCLIIDRDKESFTAHDKKDQFNYVVDKCKNNNFHLYLTNPCFEFWLLLHLTDAKELDYDELLNNCKVSSKYTFVEAELRKLMPGYKKNNPQAEELMGRVDAAIDNAELYATQIMDLKDQVGTNLHELFNELRENKA